MRTISAVQKKSIYFDKSNCQGIIIICMFLVIFVTITLFFFFLYTAQVN